MFLFLLPAYAATPLSCDGLDADLCATVNAAADEVNTQFGFDFFDASDAVPAHRRTSQLYAQLLEVSELSATCVASGYRGFATGIYDRGVGTGVSDDETGTGTVSATFGRGRFEATGTSMSVGSIGTIGEKGRYASDGKIIGKRHGDVNGSTEAGYVAGVWVRYQGYKGAFVTLYGGCELAYYENVFDSWYTKTSLETPTCPQGEEITSETEQEGEASAVVLPRSVSGNTCDGEGAIPFRQARSTEHTGHTYLYRAPLSRTYKFFLPNNSTSLSVVSLHQTCEGGAQSWTEEADSLEGAEVRLQTGETILLSIGGRLDQCGPYTIGIAASGA